MIEKYWGYFIVIVFVGMVSCDGKKAQEDLPILGRQKLIERTENGKTYYDTLNHKIADFTFFNQDSVLITNESYKGKIYVADFFFTSCPTICPSMKKQMLRIYNEFESNDQVGILSHTIDPKYDNVTVLKEYADRLEVNGSKWNLVTGDLDEIYTIGEESYMVVAGEDAGAPGGFVHSGAFLLVDMDRRIRGIYDGTIPEEVDILINDIRRLLKEYSTAKGEQN
jgi:protein SCO1